MDFSKITKDPSDENEELLLKIYSRRERRIILVWLDKNRHLIHSKDPRPVFYGGEEISGRLSIEVIGGKPVKQVKLMLVSLTQIRFSSSSQEQSNQKRRKSIFSDLYFGSGIDDNNDKSIYFQRQKILQIDLLNDDKKLNDGKHDLLFRFQLPKAGLPSSMKSFNGLIKYTIEAFTIDEETLNESRGEKEIIFLVPIYDMTVLKQINRITEKTFHIDPDKDADNVDVGGGGDDDGNEFSNNITIKTTLEKKTLNLGDIFIMELSIENLSNKNLECLISIIQRQILCYENKQQIIDNRLYVNEQKHQLIGLMLAPNEIIRREPIQINLSKNLVLTMESPMITVKYHFLIIIKAQNDDNNNNENIPPFSMEIPFLVLIDKNSTLTGVATTQINKVGKKIQQ